MLRKDDAKRRTMDAGPSTTYYKLIGELKTKAVTPINKRCQRPVVHSLDFK